jgi:Bacteriophage tail sheath protein
MPTYTAPGVYVEEVPPLARPIAGVGTSTAAFIGVMDGILAAKVGKPVFVTSFSEFETALGPEPAPNPADPPDVIRAAVRKHLYKGANRPLSLAVFGFFNNGGTACYIVPVAALGNTNVSDALEALAPIDEIAIVAAPGVTDNAIKNLLLQHCMTLEDRVAVIDGIQNPAALTVAAINGADITTLAKENTYGAIYFPWLKVANPIFKAGSADADEQVAFLSQPPSGHVAGVYARVDATRGVFKAPANESIFGVIEPERPLTKAQQGVLNPKGINVIRRFGSSTLIYGGRTLGGDLNLEFRYLSTRRYMNFLKESIDEGTQFVVFEANSPALWQRVILSVSGFLYNQWRDGALFGDTPKQAFYVKCDADTNPPSVREAGQLITEIGVAIVKPAEFVIFRIQQNAGA